MPELDRLRSILEEVGLDVRLLYHPCLPFSDDERLKYNRLIVFLSGGRAFGVYWLSYATPDRLAAAIVENQSIAIACDSRQRFLPDSAIVYLD